MCPPELPNSPACLLSCSLVRMLISRKGGRLGQLKCNFMQPHQAVKSQELGELFLTLVFRTSGDCEGHKGPD